MSDKRKSQLIYLCTIVILGVVHYFWGKPIFTFLATTLFYWLFAAVIVLLFADSIISIIKNKKVSFSAKVEKAAYFVSDWEREGNPLPPIKAEPEEEPAGEVESSEIEVESEEEPAEEAAEESKDPAECPGEEIGL